MEANKQIQMFIEAKGPDFVVEACIEKALRRPAPIPMPGKVAQTNGKTNGAVEPKAPKPRVVKEPKEPKPKKGKSPGESKGMNVVALKVLNAFPPADQTITAASLAEKLGLEAPNVRQGLRALCDDAKIQKLGGGKGTTYQRVQE